MKKKKEITPGEAVDIVIRIIRAITGQTAMPDQRIEVFGFLDQPRIRELSHNIAYHSQGVSSVGHTIDTAALSNIDERWTVEDVAMRVRERAVSINA